MWWGKLVSRIIDYKIAMLLWLALASSIGAASVGSAIHAFQGRVELALEADSLLSGVMDGTPMSENFSAFYNEGAYAG